MGTGEFNDGGGGGGGGLTLDELASHPGGVEILLVASCYGNRDKLLSDAVCRLYLI